VEYKKRKASTLGQSTMVEDKYVKSICLAAVETCRERVLIDIQ